MGGGSRGFALMLEATDPGLASWSPLDAGSAGRAPGTGGAAVRGGLGAELREVSGSER